ncbi:MAG TPA: polysaccharide deacetylase family protein [Rhizomicrobium sp.]|nr:polysaccharide deacetylase family protein [Rhizomicrobium sp.]
MSRAGQLLREVAAWCPPALARAFGRPAALFFHGVERAILDPRIQANHHAAEDFRAIAAALRQSFDVLPLAALSDVLKAPDRHPRALFLMSDDGYANTASVAADILEEAGLPWSLFVSTEHIDTGEWNPMSSARLFLFFAEAGDYSLPHLGRLALGGERESVAARALDAFRRLPLEAARETVAAMLRSFPPARLFELTERFSSERFLTWNEARALQARGVAFGAHAHWHWPMNGAQSPDELRRQARASRARIARELGECRHFAYPFGNVDDVSAPAWQAVRDAGYDYAFTTLSGSLDGGRNPWLLPRYGLGAREPNLAARVPLLRAGNGRLARWQARLSG